MDGAPQEVKILPVNVCCRVGLSACRLEMVVSSLCPNCGSANVRETGTVPVPVEVLYPEFASVRGYAEDLTPSHFCRCDSCKLHFRSQQPTADSLQEFYIHLPARNWNYDPKTVGSWCSATRQLNRLYSSSQTIRILDVGAFNGAFLSGLSTAWKKCAVEPNLNALSELNRQGIIHIGGFLDDVRLQDQFGSFDVVTMFDVFEHLIHPDVSMSTLAALLKPGGRLIVSTGNSDHWSWKLLGTSHWYLHTIQHLFVGSRGYFLNYCKQNGLVLESSINHSHRISRLRDRAVHSIETWHWWSCSQKGVRRLPAAFIQRLPGFRQLVHRTAAPFANSIADHSLFVIRKPDL